MKNENFLICLTGLPASGKSTFAYKITNVFKNRYGITRIKIVDPDIIRNKLSLEKFDPEIEPHVRKENLNIIRRELKKGYIVISDDLNYYSSMRHDLKIVAETLKIRLIIIYIATPLEVCLRWNKNRGEPIPNEVIRKINKKFDKFDKYSWDFPYAKFILSDIIDIENKIEDFIKNLIESINNKGIIEDKRDQPSNLDIENLEKVSRIYVGQLLQNSEYVPFKEKILELRREFVKNNRNNSKESSDIKISFRDYLEESLNIKIKENSD